jgi:allantoinase
MKPVARAQARVGSTLGSLAGAIFLVAIIGPTESSSKNLVDPATSLERANIHTVQWPDGKKVAVCFAFFVEEFGFGKGPVLRPDLASRHPDLVNEAFREYAINWGVPRVGRLFKELDVPLTIVLNAAFPGKHPSIWKNFRLMQPAAPIVAHGIDNTSDMLPLGRGLSAQKAYVRRTLDLIADTTGIRPSGWSSPSVYSDGDTMRAVSAEGVAYTLDQMDSDVISTLRTPEGRLILLPYPTVTVDMGQYLARLKTNREIEALWLDYVSELVNEGRADPARDAATVVIGIHPFVVGMPDGAAALRRVLLRLKADDAVWLTDTDAILKVLRRQRAGAENRDPVDTRNE